MTPLDISANPYVNVDGIERPTVDNEDNPIHWSLEGVINFWRWMGDSKLLDHKGRPIVLYHGTTGDFHEFDTEKANPESDLGGGIYLSNSLTDVEHNYAGEGPDLTSKIEYLAENLQYDLDEEGWSDGKSKDEIDAETKRLAREKLHVHHDGMIIPVYVAIKNPFVIGGDEETWLDYQETQDEDGEFTGEEIGLLVDFIRQLQMVACEYHDGNIQPFIDELMGVAIDGEISASRLFKIAENCEEFSYFNDNNSHLVSKEILRLALENTGFDGVIDHTVNDKFGSNRRMGRPMDGMDEDTIHYIAFSPNQIKSAMGNSGLFADSPSLTDAIKPCMVASNDDGVRKRRRRGP